MYSNDRLVILDADGTTVDAFSAIERTFAHHGMRIGPLARFQKRRNLFKYLGGLKELPGNLRKQLAGQKRALLIATLTEVYREEVRLYEGMETLLARLAETPGLKVGIVTRNITLEPIATLERMFRRLGFDPARLDFLVHLPLREDKLAAFRRLRAELAINPARAYACGDEARDYLAAVHSGMHPFMVSYGFEDFDRLTLKHGVPRELISQSPAELATRVVHGLGLDGPAPVTGKD
jgi:phosphoglycolate phosphatase